VHHRRIGQINEIVPGKVHADAHHDAQNRGVDAVTERVSVICFNIYQVQHGVFLGDDLIDDRSGHSRYFLRADLTFG
jgi:hypothetical protein